MNLDGFEESVARLVGEAAARSTGPISRRLGDLDRRLRAPLNVAVVGRVNAGKSTLVNALLGRHVAPTDVSECTRIVTWFRYGSPERVEAVMNDGSRRAVQLEPGGYLPRTLGVDTDAVQSLQVVLSSEVLRTMTIIDTPGLASANEEVSAVTEEFLAMQRRSSQAAETADALVFVFNQNPRADELETLQRFRSGRIGSTTVGPTGIGVLTKADQLGDATTAWGAAVTMASRYAQQLRSSVLSIVPIIGLLAETSESAALTETDFTHLRSLAALDGQDRAEMLLSVDRFVSMESDIPASARRRLLALLGLYGIEKVVELIHVGANGAAALRRELSQLSGIAELRRTIAEAFTERGRTQRSYVCLHELFQVCTTRVEDPDHDALMGVRGAAEELLQGQQARQLALSASLGSLEAGEMVVPQELRGDLERLMEIPWDSIVASDAVERVGAWRAFAFGAPPAEQALARTVIGVYAWALDT